MVHAGVCVSPPLLSGSPVGLNSPHGLLHLAVLRLLEVGPDSGLNEDDLAVLHIDWGEQHLVTQIRDVQSAFFAGRYAYDLHTGYCYTKEDSHGFVSLSDSSDHKAESVHNALRPTIASLVDKGKKRFVICSDGPTSQYRNSKNVILMKRFCEEFRITIRILFTEAGHGKSPCDGVGGNVKTELENVAMDIHGKQEIFTINKAEDVAKVLRERTNLTYTITVHKQEDTDAIRDSLGHLTSLTGALKIHEIFIGEDLVVKKKMLPSDPFYKAVLIKESRKKSTGTNVLDDDNYDSD